MGVFFIVDNKVDPNTVLLWLVEAAEHLQAWLRHFLHDVHVDQVQMDELFALRSAVKDGEVTETEAIEHLSRSPHWVWVAMDPVTKLILTIDVGERTLALAQDFVHQLVQVLAPVSSAKTHIPSHLVVTPPFRTPVCNLNYFGVSLEVLYNLLTIRGDCYAQPTCVPKPSLGPPGPCRWHVR